MKKDIMGLISLFLLCVNFVLAQGEKVSAYGIFFDNTGSMRQQLELEAAIGKEVVKKLEDPLSVSIFGFATDPTAASKMAKIAFGVQCSGDRDIINKQIDAIYVIGGQTTLLDSIKTAAESLDAAKPANCRDFSERNLIVITDGEDRASMTRAADLITALKQNGTKIYAIGLIEDLGLEGGFIGKSPQKKSKEFLETITKETGGKVVFPKKKQTASEIVEQLFSVETKKSK